MGSGGLPWLQTASCGSFKPRHWLPIHASRECRSVCQVCTATVWLCFVLGAHSLFDQVGYQYDSLFNEVEFANQTVSLDSHINGDCNNAQYSIIVTSPVAIYFSVVMNCAVTYDEIMMKVWCNRWGKDEKFRASMEPFWDLKIGEYVEYLMHVSSKYIISWVLLSRRVPLAELHAPCHDRSEVRKLYCAVEFVSCIETYHCRGVQTPSLRLRRLHQCGLYTVHALYWRPFTIFTNSYWGCGQIFHNIAVHTVVSRQMPTPR